MTFKLYIKIGLILLLAVLLMIPLGMISMVVHERDSYRNQVIRNIESTWTGSQRVAGPVLSVPYWVDVTETTTNPQTKEKETHVRRIKRVLYRVPDSLTIDSEADTEQRTIGIYSVPVYTSSHQMHGTFDLSDLQSIPDEVAGFIEWGPMAVSLLVSDIRGIGGRPTLSWNRQSVSFEAGSALPNLTAGVQARVPQPKTFSEVPFEVTLSLRGSQELSFAPLANDLTATLTSSWPHPKFDGRFLPSERTISADGFSAVWNTSSFATDAAGKLAECVRGRECHSLEQLSFGVKFFEPVDIYVKVNRAIKYGILFIALTFVSFFLIETLTRTRLHPLQYALVGLALAVFYLLLVSLSEHVSFTASYAIATLACAGLIGVYLKGALQQTRLAATFSVGIALLYAMLFAILKSEDFALLMGSLLLFAMLALVMVLTRRIDWYSVGTVPVAEPAESD